MADVATLGIKIDSSSAVQGAANLDKLTAASAKATKAAGDLEARSGAVAAAAKRAGISYDDMAARIAKSSAPLVKAQEDVAKGAKGLTDALGGGNGAAGAFDKADKSSNNFVNTLTRRFLLGFAISQVKNLATNVASLNAELARSGDIGRLTGMGAGQTQGVASAAAGKGIDNKTISDAMVTFNQQIPLAKAGVGDFGALLRANKMTVTDTGDAFFKVADLVKNAANDTARLSILQQAGLPATIEMARFMGQGAAAIKAQADAASKLTDQQIDDARRLEDRWNEMWNSFTTFGKRAAVGISDAFRQISTPNLPGYGNRIGASFDELGSAGSGGTGLRAGLEKRAGQIRSGSTQDTTRDFATEKAIAQDRISKAQQYLGLLGSTTTALEAQRTIQLQADSAKLNGVGIDGKRLELIKQLAAEQTIGVTAIKASIDAQNIEVATIGMSVGQAQAYTAAQNALNAARRDGRALTVDNIAQIQSEANKLGVAAQRADDMKFAYESLVRGPLQTFNSALQQGAGFWGAFEQAGRSALNSISSKLIDMATQKLWSAAFGGTGGGGFSLGSLFGGGNAANSANTGFGDFMGPRMPAGINHTGYGPGDRSPMRYIHPAHFNDAPRFHTGIGPGERAAVIQNTESVLTAGQMKALAPVGSGDVQVNVYNAPAGTNAAVTQTKTAGGTRIDVTLQRHMDDTSAMHISSGESATNKALEQRYGLQPRL